uniref:Uncharacterized protein n=1 Tax=Yersinia enterocolitica TaxID=630 RepID=B0RKJ1_YEREN|nr:hypothetical protein [Yersinia enterocolitica]
MKSDISLSQPLMYRYSFLRVLSLGLLFSGSFFRPIRMVLSASSMMFLISSFIYSHVFLNVSPFVVGDKN